MPNPLVPMPSWPQVREATKKFVATAKPPPPPEVFRDDYADDDPDAISPSDETVGQGFIPYRGYALHGVPAGEMTDSGPQGYGDGSVAVAYDDDSRPDPVVNVRVISDGKEEIKAFRTGQTSVADRVTSIVNRSRQRTSLKIKHLGATGGVGDTRVWIGHDANVSALNGYPLDPGGEITFSSTEAVYAISNTATVAPLALFYDFTQDI